MNKILRVLSLILVCALMMSASAFAAESQYGENEVTIGELFEQMGIGVDGNTTFSIEEYTVSEEIKTQGVRSVQEVESKDVTAICAQIENDDGSMSEYVIFAASSESEIESVSATPSANLTGSTVDYNSRLSDEHDYYFAIGSSYSSAKFNGYYAFRPSSMYMYLREEGDDCVGVDYAELGLSLSGDWVNSSGTVQGDGGFGATLTKSNPVSGRQYSQTLSSKWSSEGYGSSDYIWVFNTAVYGYNYVFEVEFADGKYVTIEHAVYGI